MIKAPDLDQIYAAELKLAQAKTRTLDGGRRAGFAMKSALARPSSLALVAAAGFCGGWLVSGRYGRPASRTDAKTAAGKGAIAGLVLPLVLQAASRIFPAVLSRIWKSSGNEAIPVP